MKTSSVSRPCAEFPSDNPRLHASVGHGGDRLERGPASEHGDVGNSGVPPQVGAHDEPRLSEFDWAVTDYWVKEVRRRWRVAKADAPEVNLPVLDAMGLELCVGAQQAPSQGVGEDALMLEESALAESGVMLGELLVMPSETLFDDAGPASLTDALGLELAECGAAGAERSPLFDVFAHAESGEVPIVDEGGVEGVSTGLALATEGDSSSIDELSDPFIDELLRLVPCEGHGLALREIVSRSECPGELAEASNEDAGEARTVPAVAESAVAEPPAPSPLLVMSRGVQPLPPLQFELTPTPAALGPWSELTGALSRHLLSGGHTRAAALVAPLLCGELVDFSRVEPAAIERLIKDGIVEVRGGRPVTSPTFRHAAKTFREEFGTGGLNAADALFWLSQVLVGLCGGSADEEKFEGELRDLGVAKLLEWAA